jgi:hypothetical protein
MVSATHLIIEGMIMTCDISKTKQTIGSYVHYRHRRIHRGLIHRGFLYDDKEIHVVQKYFY